MKYRLQKKYGIIAFLVLLAGFYGKNVCSPFSLEEMSMIYCRPSLGLNLEKNDPSNQQDFKNTIKFPFKRFRFLKAKVDPKWEISYSPEELANVFSILDQPLHFLGSGRQCYAFVTEDDQYVVKISRNKRGPEHHSDFSKYFCAYEQIPLQSQIVFLHLVSSDDLPVSLKIIDAWGISHMFPAENLVFYIQKKLTPLSLYLKSSSQLHPIDARLLVEKLLDLCLTTSQQYIEVHDIALSNIGAFEEKCYWLDVGGVHKREEDQEKIFLRLVARVKRCCKALYVETDSLMEELLPQKLQELNSLRQNNS